MQLERLVLVVLSVCILACAPIRKDKTSTMLTDQAAERHPQVDQDLEVYDAEIAKMKNALARLSGDAGDKDWVKQSLLAMFRIDEYTRYYSGKVYKKPYSEAEQDYFWQQFSTRLQAVDAANTASLKGILTHYPWIYISQFGLESDMHAWLLLDHADQDPLFQKEILERLKDMVHTPTTKRETNRSNYARFYDRLAIRERRPQLYGTQGDCDETSKGWKPAATEDMENLEKRREDMGLEPLAAYAAKFTVVCK